LASWNSCATLPAGPKRLSRARPRSFRAPGTQDKFEKISPFASMENGHASD
jgi:hypothetical protein